MDGFWSASANRPNSSGTAHGDVGKFGTITYFFDSRESSRSPAPLNRLLNQANTLVTVRNSHTSSVQVQVAVANFVES